MFAKSEKKNIYPCLSWVRAGCAKQTPDKVGLNKDELKKIIEETQEKLAESGILSSEEEEEEVESGKEEEEGVAAAVAKAEKIAEDKFNKKVGSKRKLEEGADNDEDVAARYGLDDYDDEDDLAYEYKRGIGNLTQFASYEEDPYITLKEEDSDEEDFVLKPTDNLLALGRVATDASVLDVHVYNGELVDMYAHHEYILPTLPLVIEWMDYDIADGDKGNFVAMGTMEPDISIWDLDVVGCLEPVAVLEGCKAKRKKKMKKKETVIGGHTDAVLDLSWNSNARNVLASGSADNTVCLWDLSAGKVVTTLQHHQQQVQCVSWHPVENQLLLTGSFDESVAVVDCRSPEDSVKRWKLKGEVERAIWNHLSPLYCLACTDQGMLYCMDTRKDKPVYELSAHDKACTGLSLSSQIAGLLVTTSDDKLLKVWDILDGKPSLVLSRKLGMDILHCVEGNPDHPFVFAIGGNTGFKVWDIRESAAVRKHFLGRMPANLAAECENDEGDLAEESEAMANLNVEDDEEEREMEEIMAGDRGKGAKKQGSAESQNKKKKKRKKKKNNPAS